MQDLGIIEGFYGRMFSEKGRLALMDFAAGEGYRSYIYAPKGIGRLRTRFKEGLNAEERALLQRTSQHARKCGLNFGIGISPVNLTLSYTEDKTRFEELCLDYVESFELATLAVLFDDVKLQSEDVGLKQAQIMNSLSARLHPSSATRRVRLIFCPAYYSFDPILDKLFGKRPARYYAELKDNLAPDIEIYWTGIRVLSEDHTPSDLKRIHALLGRPVRLWDNYPVNDGKRISEYLNLKPFKGRRHLEGLITGHDVNPMNELTLNRLPLVTLPLIYAGAEESVLTRRWVEEAHALFGTAAPFILDHLSTLTQKGLSHIPEDEKEAFLKVLREALQATSESVSHSALSEMAAFLLGEYRFDPACLTS